MSDATHENYRMLASAIIERAVKDRRKYKARSKGWALSGITTFFKSEWFETLADLVGLDPDYIRRSIGET